MLALRGGQGAALEAAADGFLDACRAGADLPLPPFVRASMEAPLLSAAGTVLADVGSPHALISASAAFWRPGSGSASGSAGLRRRIAGAQPAADAQRRLAALVVSSVAQVVAAQEEGARTRHARRCL